VLVATPGSLSTVVLAMLGGHPALWPAPELHLFSAQDLDGLMRADAAVSGYLGARGVFTAGLSACLHELGLLGKRPPDLSAIECWGRRRKHWPPGRTLAELEAAAAPRRLVVKSGFLALDRRALTRLREARPDAMVIALVRHPVDAVASLLRRAPGTTAPGLAAHLLSLWLAAPGPAQAVEAGSLYVLKAEDATSRPRAALAALLSALELPLDEATLEAMLRTEEASFLPAARRMPGLLADDSFAASPQLRARAPSHDVVFPAAWGIPDGLAGRARQAAAALGYRCKPEQDVSSAGGEERASPWRHVPHSVPQQK
jgi:hypothetical protein